MTNHFLNSAKTHLPEAIITKKVNDSKNWTLLHLGAGIGLLGGTGILFCAIFLTIVEFLYSEKPHGSWLFLSVLPLWVIGAVCLDKLEDAEKAKRIEYCKRTGMMDKDCENYKYTN